VARKTKSLKKIPNTENWKNTIVAENMKDPWIRIPERSSRDPSKDEELRSDP
jgi:hypothetical protein